MKERMLAIIDHDGRYAKALSDYLNRQEEFPFLSSAYSSVAEYLEGARQKQDDMILMESAIAEEYCDNSGYDNVVIRLTDTRRDLPELAWIYKFQSAQKIMREVMIYAGEKGTVAAAETPEIVTVFSCRSARERSLYARDYCRREQEEAGDVLFVDLEMFPGEVPGENAEGRGMSELIFQLKQHPDGDGMYIRSLIEDGEAYRQIRPVQCSMDLLELTEEETAALIRQLRALQEYRVIVLEIDFYGERALQLFRESSRIRLVEGADPGDGRAVAFFREQLVRMRQGFEQKVEVIHLDGG